MRSPAKIFLKFFYKKVKKSIDKSLLVCYNTYVRWKQEDLTRKDEKTMTNEMKMKALINWSEKEQRWILSLWIDNEWVFSKSWKTRDPDYNGNGLVSDSIICEIANLQNLGYDVTVTV